jgi:hypothetical protein
MTNINHRHVETAGPGIEGVLFGKIGSDAEAQIRVSETNRSLEEADRRFWGNGPAGGVGAVRLLEQFGATAAALEAWGGSAERIQADLGPSRQVFATSSFMRRCQQWPRGYAGDLQGCHCSLSSTARVRPKVEDRTREGLQPPWQAKSLYAGVKCASIPMG